MNAPRLALLGPLGCGLAAVLVARRLGALDASAALVLADCALFGAGVGALGVAAPLALRWRAAASRYALVGALGALLGLGHLLLAPAGPAVMIVVIDCLRADRLNEQTSPRLMEFAQTSHRFTQAQAHSTWTRSSVPSLLSSLLPIEHRLYSLRPVPDRLADSVRLVSQDFKAADWRTALFAHQPQLSKAFGYGRGFHRHGRHDGAAPKLHLRFLAWHLLNRQLPRFVYMHHIGVHGPYDPKRSSVAQPRPKAKVPVHKSKAWDALSHDINKGRRTLSADEWAYVAAMYDGETREIDAELGWLFELLELDGSLDQTWTVITSDHGEALGEHNRAVHTGPPWEVLIHVPLLIRPPGGLAQGQVHDDLVGLIDVVPTLLSQVGLPAVPAHAGRDLSPLLRGEPLAAVPQFAEEKFAARHRASVRDGDWKLIAEGPRRWLFNLAADPGETVDLAIAEPAQVAALEGLLAVWFQAAQAGVPSSSMDWEAARRSGMRWEAPRVQTETVGGDADELLRQLEAMGYVEVGDD